LATRGRGGPAPALATLGLTARVARRQGEKGEGERDWKSPSLSPFWSPTA
jgi:hypothetical protein